MAAIQYATGTPALIAIRASTISPSLHVLRSGPILRQQLRCRAFGTRKPQRVLSLKVQAAASDVIAPVAEVVKRLQGKVYVAGVSGQLGARIVKELLQAGVPVVAGVPEGDPADDALDFALQFELIKKQEAKNLTIREVDFADADSFGIPRGATVLVVMGDAQGKRKMDAKLVGQAVDAAIKASAARIVLATPLGGGGGGARGFFGGFFGGGGGGTVAGTGDLKLSRPEQQVYNSGLPFSIVRVGAPGDSLTPAGNVEVTAAGGTSKGAALSRAQAAKVVTEVLQQSPRGTSVVLEAGVSEAAAPTPISFAVAEVLPDAEIAAEEEEVEEEEEEEEAPAARPSPARRAVRQASSAAEDAAEDVEEEAEEAAPAFDLKSFFGGGGRGAPKAKAVVDEIEEDLEEAAEEAAEKAPKPFQSLFGGKPRQAQREAAEEVEEAAEKAPKPFQSFFGGKPRQAQREAAEEVEEAVDKAPKPFQSLFGGKPRQAQREAAAEADKAAKPFRTLFGRKPKQAQQEVKQGTRRVERAAKQKGRGAASAASRSAKQVKAKAEEAAPRQQGGSVFRSLLGLDEGKDEEAEAAPKPRFGLGNGTRRVSSKPEPKKADKRAPAKQVSRSRSASKQAEDKPEKKGGFLSALGFNQETVYADDD